MNGFSITLLMKIDMPLNQRNPTELITEAYNPGVSWKKLLENYQFS